MPAATPYTSPRHGALAACPRLARELAAGHQRVRGVRAVVRGIRGLAGPAPGQHRAGTGDGATDGAGAGAGSATGTAAWVHCGGVAID